MADHSFFLIKIIKKDILIQININKLIYSKKIYQIEEKIEKKKRLDKNHHIIEFFSLDFSMGVKENF